MQWHAPGVDPTTLPACFRLAYGMKNIHFVVFAHPTQTGRGRTEHMAAPALCGARPAEPWEWVKATCHVHNLCADCVRLLPDAYDKLK